MLAHDELPDTVDVAIVGGGIMGTSSCFFLSEKTDLTVLLVEKNSIANGSTGDSSAIIRHHYGPTEIYSKMALWSHEFYREFEARTGEPVAYEPSPLLRLGIEGDSSGEYAMDGYETLSSLDIPVSRLEREALVEEYPMLSPLESDFGVSDETAAYSDAADAAAGFSRAAQNRGAIVRTGVTVADIGVDDGEVTEIQTDHGTVETDTLIVTAGPWTAQLMETVDVDIPLTHSREQILLLEPPEEFLDTYPEGMPTTSPPGADWYVREDFGDGILIATHHSANDPDPNTYRKKPDEEVKLRLIDELADFCPELEDAKLRGQYCGIYSNTPDYDFVIDQVGPDGCYVGCGFSGHGFKHGPAVGRIVSDLVRDGHTDLVDAQYFSLDRFKGDGKGHGNPEESA
ncbi:NAD(P)/FAD-dependent oxidoreductase [Natribaculum luteum]|uniref:NAD(P)/FAD-dependent oxidoreductase n=1 Tax=Natribaculum luteum TaxID=1586232 RepID=A0ABD5NVG1_9EURY|nr:FAD-dependent oxidoreductase [Natribaculum luteum]